MFIWIDVEFVSFLIFLLKIVNCVVVFCVRIDELCIFEVFVLIYLLICGSDDWMMLCILCSLKWLWMLWVNYYVLLFICIVGDCDYGVF